jgi:hypothetical protein
VSADLAAVIVAGVAYTHLTRRRRDRELPQDPGQPRPAQPATDLS